MIRIVRLETLGVLFLLWACASTAAPNIVAHRGASGYRPEHTLAAYALGLEQGADFIEVDLVSTEDGILICRHDCELGSTTDVAEKFPHRQRTGMIGGKRQRGFFAQDFTWKEIKQLRTRERTAFRSRNFDGIFSIPSFGEVLQLVEQYNKTHAKKVGVCPELKNPTYHRQQALPLEEPLLKLLNHYGYESSHDRCVIQSFDPDCLRNLRTQTDLRLLQLMPQLQNENGSNAIPTDEALAEVATYASLIGVPKASIVNHRLRGSGHQPTGLIGRADQHGLKVWVYTFRETPWMMWYAPRFAREVRQFADLEPDGLFTDFPDLVRRSLGRPPDVP